MRVAVLSQDGGADGLWALRSDGRMAVWAVLLTELHIEQAQEVVNLGQRAHRALAATATGALLNGHRGWDAIDCVDFGPRSWLNWRA